MENPVSTSNKVYYQCLLRRGMSQQHAWIESRGATEGALVELLPSREQWRVHAVFSANPLPEDQLKELKSLNRASLPSVEAMR